MLTEGSPVFRRYFNGKWEREGGLHEGVTGISAGTESLDLLLLLLLVRGGWGP